MLNSICAMRMGGAGLGSQTAADPLERMQSGGGVRFSVFGAQFGFGHYCALKSENSRRLWPERKLEKAVAVSGVCSGQCYKF